MKQRIFIGSSSEELGTANIVKGLLEHDFEVVIWNENMWDKSVFKLNNNFLHDLLKAPLKFDFGILIGTPDDKVESRGKELLQARDNIMFELGLFIGRLGIDKCAYLVEKSVKDMSDLNGIFLSKFDSTNLAEKVVEIKEFFLLSSSNKFNFFPSNTLAYGYFENFVKSLCSEYLKVGKFVVDGSEFENCRINVIIPNHLDEDVNLQFEKLKREQVVKTAQLDYHGRPRPFFVDAKSFADGRLEILDYPTTLTGINYAIKELLPDEYKSYGDEYKFILSRELDRFAETLENLIIRNGFKDFVEIIRV